MKKLFGGINLTWKKLIIFSVIAGVYTAVMALLPCTKDTSFRDIAIMFEWWIFFGIIIIANSKNPTDSALKCFVFFLISQPLVYLIQVPFSSMGWKLFGYYRYWFYWTLACLPMGFIGYYINKKNLLSVIILMPMFIELILQGAGYLNSAVESFPNHLLSGIACFLMIVVVTIYLFDELKYKIITLGLCLVGIIILFVLGLDKINSKYEVVRTLDTYEIELKGEVLVTYFSGTESGIAEIVLNEPPYSIKLEGYKGADYEFTIVDEEDHSYDFKYSFNKKENTVELILIK